MPHIVRIDNNREQCLSRVTVAQSSQIPASSSYGDENKVDVDDISSTYDDRFTIPVIAVDVGHVGGEELIEGRVPVDIS